jgi:hypothetical protein
MAAISPRASKLLFEELSIAGKVTSHSLTIQPPQMLVALKRPRTNSVEEERTGFLWQIGVKRTQHSGFGPQCLRIIALMDAVGQTGSHYEISENEQGELRGATRQEI